MVDFRLQFQKQQAQHAHEGERMRSISASQVKTWQTCKRKWWLDKVAKVKEADKYHFVIGHALHGVAERYLERRAQDWEGLFPAGWDAKLREPDRAWVRRGAQAAVELGLWKAKPTIRVEVPICYLVGPADVRGLPLLAEARTGTTSDGTRIVLQPTRLLDGRALPQEHNQLPYFVGFIDVLDLDPAAALVGDHKSSKSRKYALSPAKLAKDLQVNAYAALPLSTLGLTKVSLHHNVFLKDPEAPEPVYGVDAETDVQTVAQVWADIIQAAQDMEAARKVAPVPQTERGKPPSLDRAKNWHLIQGAMNDPETKSACNAYGGCPFRDLCSSRCSARQMVERLDAAAAKPIDFTKPVEATKAPTFALNLKPGAVMFAKPTIKPTLAVGQDCYIRDPQDQAHQYRARLHRNSAQEDCSILVYPDADVVPDFNALAEVYCISGIPLAELSAVPWPGASVLGYAAALTAAGHVAPAWTPAVLPVAATDKLVTRPAPDGKFAMPGMPAAAPAPTAAAAAAAAPVPAAPAAASAAAPAAPDGAPPTSAVQAMAAANARAQAAEAEAVQALPAATFQAHIGDTVQVIPSQIQFWQNLAGKQGRVEEVTIGEGGHQMLSVEIDGISYDAVAGRFSIVARAETAQETAQEGTAVAPQPASQAALALFKGQIVTINVHGTTNPFNGLLEDVTAEGITMMGGALKLRYDQISAFGAMTVAAIPGMPVPKPKKPGRKSKADKEAEAAAQAAQAPAQAASAPVPVPAAPAPATAAVPLDTKLTLIGGYIGDSIKRLQEGLHHVQQMQAMVQQRRKEGQP